MRVSKRCRVKSGGTSRPHLVSRVRCFLVISADDVGEWHVLDRATPHAPLLQLVTFLERLPLSMLAPHITWLSHAYKPSTSTSIGLMISVTVASYYWNRPSSGSYTGNSAGNELLRLAGDADEVDAVAVAAAIGEVVAKVGAGGGNGLAVLQHTHVVPHDLLVPETGRSGRREGLS